MRKFYTAFASTFLLLFASFSSYSQPISYQLINGTGLNEPMDIAIPPNAVPADGSTRIFVAQRGGLVRLWNGTSFSTLMNMDTAISLGGERGLLSMTFHPSYDGVTNRDFFVYYTNTGGDLTVARYRTQVGDPSAIDPAGSWVVTTPIEHSSQSNHNGGDLNFGPDGFLYLTTGDGGGGGDPAENAQNPASLLGKFLRINVNGVFPVTPQVVDIGLRNPFRWTFDRLTGDAWIGDVGQDEWEEITRKPAASSGLNFGWDCYEGNEEYEDLGCPATGFTFPEYVYTNPAEGRSVIGGYVYRGSEFPQLYGWYVATDYFTGNIFRRSPTGIWTVQANPSTTTVVSIGEAPDGTLYAINQNNDDLFKLTVTGPLPVSLTEFSGTRADHTSRLKWTTAAEQNTARFRVEFSRTAGNFQTAGFVTASRNPSGSQYSFDHHLNDVGTLYYRLAIEDDDGSVSYSPILRMDSPGKDKSKVYPTLIRDRIMNLSLAAPVQKMQLVNSGGAIVFEKALNNQTGEQSVRLPLLPNGLYVVRLVMSHEVQTSRIIIE